MRRLEGLRLRAASCLATDLGSGAAPRPLTAAGEAPRSGCCLAVDEGFPNVLGLA